MSAKIDILLIFNIKDKDTQKNKPGSRKFPYKRADSLTPISN